MKLLSLVCNAAIVALWIALFVKSGFTIEGTLACIAFYVLNSGVLLITKLLAMNLELLKLSTAAYQKFQQQQRNQA